MKRTTKAPSNMGTPYFVWREKPTPGPEQIELERLINSGEVLGDSADEVRKTNELFLKFSPSVFNSHFRKTKARLGQCATVTTKNNAPLSLGSIPELVGATGHSSGDAPASHMETLPPIRFTNAPFWTWEYFDHERNMDFVCVALVTFCGARNIRFEISEDGMSIVIHYVWPTAIYKAVEMFATARHGTDVIPMQHTKVHSFVANALKHDVSVNSVPKGVVQIALPRKVQRIPSSWKKEAISVDDTNIILLEFSAEHKEIVIEDADTSISFPKADKQ